MSKLSYEESKTNKINGLDKYYRSYLELFKFNQKKKRDKKVLKYKKSHSDEETFKYENELALEDGIALQLKEEKLHKRFLRKQDNIEKSYQADKKRIWEIDFVRGFIIIGMLIDHFIGDFWMVTGPLGIKRANDFFDFMYVFASGYWAHPARVAVRLLGVMLLLVLCGISSRFSKRSWLHSLIILAFGGVMSLAFGITSIVISDFTMNVVMGAITCIGLCLLIYNLVKLLFYNVLKIGEHFKWFALFFAVAILVMWGFASCLNPDMVSGALEKYGFWEVYNNYALCIRNIYTAEELKTNLWKVLLGLNYFGADWLALFPYLGYMFLGGFIGETVYKNKKSLLSRIKSKKGIDYNEKFNHSTKVFTFCGKKSMWFYLLHQPVFIVFIVLIALMMGLTIKI